MRRTHIEFGRIASTERRIACICLIVLLVVSAFSALFYWRTIRAVTSLGALLQEIDQPVDRDRVLTDPKQEEIQRTKLKAAQSIVERLRTPWPSLFVALEDSIKGDVSVLRIEPDPAHQEVRITADTKTMSEAVAYATGLQSTGTLTRVYIASQRASAADLLNPLQVVIVGRWTVAVPDARDRAVQALNGPAKW
jgi:hypothetical protein